MNYYLLRVNWHFPCMNELKGGLFVLNGGLHSSKNSQKIKSFLGNRFLLVIIAK